MYAIKNMIWGHGNEGDFMIFEQPEQRPRKFISNILCLKFLFQLCRAQANTRFSQAKLQGRKTMRTISEVMCPQYFCSVNTFTADTACNSAHPVCL